jgi:hypothetical protein
MELSILKLLEFTYTIHTVGLSIHYLKLYGVGYIAVTKIIVNVNNVYQKLDLISQTLWMLDSFFLQLCPSSSKDILYSNKYKNFTLSLRLSIIHTLLAWEDYNFYLGLGSAFAFLGDKFS